MRRPKMMDNQARKPLKYDHKMMAKVFDQAEKPL